MQKNIMLYINKLEGLKAAVKNIHWSSPKMPEHEYMDDLEKLIADHQDYVAEIAQGIFGKIKNNELKSVKYTIKTPTKLIKDILKAAESFYSTIQKNKKYIGLRSVMEDFMAKINQAMYMLEMTLIESIVGQKINMINENKYMNKNINEGFNWDKTGDQECDYLNNLLKQTNHLFRDEEDRNQTWMSYSEKCRRQGAKPSLDGFLNYCGLSRKDLMGAEDFYSGANFNKLQKEDIEKTIRLTESDLQHIIEESITKILKESAWYDTKPFENIIDCM